MRVRNPLLPKVFGVLLFGDLEDGVNALDRIFLPDGITPIAPLRSLRPSPRRGIAEFLPALPPLLGNSTATPARAVAPGDLPEIYKSITPILYRKIDSHHGPAHELLPLLSERHEAPWAK
jgi:hypothetical protein